MDGCFGLRPGDIGPGRLLFHPHPRLLLKLQQIGLPACDNNKMPLNLEAIIGGL